MHEAGQDVGVIGILSFVLTWLLTRWLIPRFILLLSKGGLLRGNYRGEMIPASVGLVFFCGILPGSLVVLLFTGSSDIIRLFVWLWGLGTMALVGFMDDTLGDRSVTGLKGHLAALWKKCELTTGMVKAVAGLLVGIGGVVAGPKASLASMFLQLLVIVLSINLVNLLDLRPGRAGKFFLVTSLGVVGLALVQTGLGLGRPQILLQLLVMSSVFAYLQADLQGRVMMGDSGSNILGVSLGLTSAWLLPDNILLWQACGLVVVHIFAERYSISELVERVALLRFLDGLGRPRN